MKLTYIVPLLIVVIFWTDWILQRDQYLAEVAECTGESTSSDSYDRCFKIVTARRGLR